MSQSFKLHFWLKSEEEELEFLRKISEALLLVMLPKCHAKSAPIRRLLREVAANASKMIHVPLLNEYRKIPKYSDTVIILKLEQCGSTIE